MGGVVDSRLTFSRGSTATYADSAGVMQTAAINAPRFHYNPATGVLLGLLHEKDMTNFLLRSERLDTVTWTKTRSSIGANTQTAPDGTLSMDELIEDATVTATHEISQSATYALNTPYTCEVFAKANTRSRMQILLPAAQFGANTSARFDLSAGTVLSSGAGAVKASIEQWPNGVYRCRLTGSCILAGTAPVTFQLDDGTGVTYSGDGTSGLWLWGAQLTRFNYSSSYIPNPGGVAQSRSRDVVDIADTSIFNHENGMFAIELYNWEGNHGDREVFYAVTDGTGNNLHAAYDAASLPTSQNMIAVSKIANTHSASLDLGAEAVDGAVLKVGQFYSQDGTGTGSYGAMLNGGTPVTNTDVDGHPQSGLNQWQLGNAPDGDTDKSLSAILRRFRYWDKVAADPGTFLQVETTL